MGALWQGFLPYLPFISRGVGGHPRDRLPHPVLWDVIHAEEMMTEPTNADIREALWILGSEIAIRERVLGEVEADKSWSILIQEVRAFKTAVAVLTKHHER